MIRPPSIAPIANAIKAVVERATDRPDARAVAKARIKMFPVMFAVKTLPRDRKLTASTKPVTAVIPTNTEGAIFSAIGFATVEESFIFHSVSDEDEAVCTTHRVPKIS